MTTSSIRSALDREENRIKADLLRMGSMVESAIEHSIAALKQRDGGLAQQIVDDDKLINDLRYRVEDECLTVIATQQPAAHDLRIIVAATHVAVELERMADHAAGIASITLRMLDQPLLKPGAIEAGKLSVVVSPVSVSLKTCLTRFADSRCHSFAFSHRLKLASFCSFSIARPPSNSF